jgi:hypothetical protein
MAVVTITINQEEIFSVWKAAFHKVNFNVNELSLLVRAFNVYYVLEKYEKVSALWNHTERHYNFCCLLFSRNVCNNGKTYINVYFSLRTYTGRTGNSSRLPILSPARRLLFHVVYESTVSESIVAYVLPST